MLGLCEDIERGAVGVKMKGGGKAGPTSGKVESSGWVPITSSPSASPAAAAV